MLKLTRVSKPYTFSVGLRAAKPWNFIPSIGLWMVWKFKASRLQALRKNCIHIIPWATTVGIWRVGIHALIWGMTWEVEKSIIPWHRLSPRLYSVVLKPLHSKSRQLQFFHFHSSLWHSKHSYGRATPLGCIPSSYTRFSPLKCTTNQLFLALGLGFWPRPRIWK